MTATISAQALRERLLARSGELCFLDVREQGTYGRGHLLQAANLPLSHLELEIADRVPRLATPIVLCDGGAGLVDRAAAKLVQFGYTDITVLTGDHDAWRAAGFEIFEGVYVPSKAFGEFVEATYDTPRVTAEQLAGLKAQDRDLVILDSRPADEYQRMNIPDGINVPGAELVHRVFDLAPDPETLVVVNCAGRTRSIIGAQSLINAGIENPVVALENGTMGWSLAGLDLEHGQARVPPALSNVGRAKAQNAAAAVAKRFGIATIDRAQLDAWRDDQQDHTLYICDVRSPDEYLAGHLAGARNTPGGQLVQSTDSYIPTQGARVVLVDDDGVRATMTASWLIQMGRDNVHVLDPARGSDELESGPPAAAIPALEAIPPGYEIAAVSLGGLLPGRDVTIIDLADSRAYQAGHIPGAWFAIRANLADSLSRMPSAPLYVLTSPDGVLAQLALGELAAHAREPVKVLLGGTAAWREHGYPLTEGTENMADEPDDLWLAPYFRAAGDVEDAMKYYLTWETALPAQIARDGTADFKAFD